MSDNSDESYANIDAQDVAEVVDDSQAAPEESIEIDMRNNSAAYFDRHTDSVYFIASHPKVPLVATGGGDDTLYLWTTTHNPPRLAAKLTEHTESVICGGFTANGRFLVTGDMSGRLIVWKASADFQKWQLLSNTQESDEIVHIALHPALSMFAVSDSEGQIWVYEISDDVENIAVLSAHTLPATACVFAPSTSGVAEEQKPRLLSASEDGLVVSWDVYGNQAEYTLGASALRGKHAWVSMCVSPSGKTVAVGSMDGQVAIIKLADGAVLQMVDTTIVKPKKQADQPPPSDEDEEEELGFSLEGISWSETGLLATGNVEGVVAVWDTKTWRPRFSFELADAVTQLDFVPGAPKLLTASCMDGTVVQYDVISSEQVWELLGHAEGVLGFVTQEAGARVITAGDDHVCLVFDK